MKKFTIPNTSTQKNRGYRFEESAANFCGEPYARNTRDGKNNFDIECIKVSCKTSSATITTMTEYLTDNREQAINKAIQLIRDSACNRYWYGSLRGGNWVVYELAKAEMIEFITQRTGTDYDTKSKERYGKILWKARIKSSDPTNCKWLEERL